MLIDDTDPDDLPDVDADDDEMFAPAAPLDADRFVDDPDDDSLHGGSFLP
jgi:hypothetical protein